jgi:hypothetical protein
MNVFDKAFAQGFADELQKQAKLKVSAVVSTKLRGTRPLGLIAALRKPRKRKK